MEPTRSDALRPEQTRNPYAPPGSRLDGPAAAFDGGGGGVSALILEHLKQTRPWVQLMAVLGFIGTFGPWHGAEVLARAFVRFAF